MFRPLPIKSVLILLLLACITTTMHTMAAPISRQQAQQNALSFMQERGKSITMASLRHAPMRAVQPNEIQPYYVFNIGDNQGYVIASGDDCAYAVLGYSDEGSIDLNNIPCNLQAWLDGYTQQIQYLQEHGLNSSRAPKKIANHSAIAPLLTSSWGQWEPYNMYCPIDPESGRRTPTGCVATAMAQVMYYYRHRSINYNLLEIPSYTTDTRQIYIDSIPSGTVIDWDNMLDSYGNYSYPNEAQKQAVANLMRICGTATMMDYKTGGSGAGNSGAMHALQFYFNYSSKARWKRRSGSVSVTGEVPYYSDEEWDGIIYNELANYRPVLYSGLSKQEGVGHAFVCDGYDGNGYYHFNWGWSGSSDGYFYLAASDAEEGLMGYLSQQDAIINLEPRASLPDPNAGIHFTDPYFKFNCLIMGDANDDGSLTMEEAAAVTDFSLAYYRNKISSFDEFKYFTGVTSLGDYAFSGCSSLTNFDIPNSVDSIGMFAFSGCSLSSVTIPAFVTYIGYGALQCGSLTDLYWNAKNCAINYDNGLEIASLDRVTIGDQVEVIPDYFINRMKNVKSVKISNSVKTIGQNAFYNCTGLTSIDIPDSVTSIGFAAFKDCSGLKNVSIGSEVCSIGNDAFSDTKIQNLTWHSTNCSPSGFGFYKSSVENLRLGNEFKEIPHQLLSSVMLPLWKQSLKCVTIPNTVTSIGYYAFRDFEGLTDVVIGRNVTFIDFGAFEYDVNLSTVTSLSLNPPRCKNKDVFGGYSDDTGPYVTATLRVPIEAVDTYKSTYPWSLFNTIVGMDPSSGDVNQDGEINVADINSIINNIIGFVTDNMSYFMSDVNRDGVVSIADINVLVDIILSH